MQSRRVIARRRSVSLAFVFAAVVSLGCGDDEAPADSASAIGGTAGAAAPQPARTPNMPAPFATITLEAFNGYIATLGFDPALGEQNVERLCKPPDLAACQNPNQRPRVDIDPAKDTDGIDPANLHEYGHVVARLHNDSPLRRENRYDIPPSTTVYWLVTAGRSQFVWFDAAGNRRSVGASPFTACKKKETHSKKAGFRRCPIPDAATAAESAAFIAGSPDKDPAWISCVPGCCVAAEAI